MKCVLSVFMLLYKGMFLDDVVGNFDLYVLIWGSVMLVFFIAFGSAWGKFNMRKSEGWLFDVKLVSLSVVLIYGYVFLFLFIVYMMLMCYVCVDNLRVIDVWCLYGYSIFVFISVCILVIVFVELFWWLFIGVCVVLSMLFFMFNVCKCVLLLSKGMTFVVSFVSFIGVAYFVFALIFKFFFF